MFSVLISMAMIIVLGVVWRSWLGAEKAQVVRTHLVKAVYDIFLPALVLNVMWQATVDVNALKLPMVAVTGVIFALALAWLCYVVMPWFVDRKDRQMIGALLLASSFGNFTYLGLPVITQTFGAEFQFVAIYFDFFAATPLLFTVGVIVALTFGFSEQRVNMVQEVVRVPAIWAAVIGVALSVMGVAMPSWLAKSLSLLAAAVVPLMLLAVGMALAWRAGWLKRLPMLLPMALIQLLWMPWVVWTTGELIALPSSWLAPAVIEAAMPCMVLGIVLCDRFHLDASLYAEAVTVTTAISLLSLPVWLTLL